MAEDKGERDYFAELMPERSDADQCQGSQPTGEPDLMFSEEPPVLPMPSTAEVVTASPGLPALDVEEAKSATPNGPSLKPMGEGLGRKQARETQEIIETVVSRFANGLQTVLEHTNK